MSDRRLPRARIAWHGEFLGEASLARINRHLARAARERGNLEVVACGEPTPLVESTLGLRARRREDLPENGTPQVLLRHRWPPRFMNPPTGHYVHVQPWEFGAAPLAWIERLRARADAVWCYSSYVRDVYVSSGIDTERVAVLPLGFDPLVYHPDVEPLPSDPGVCVFLYVGAMPQRKNIELLVQAYLQAFVRGERVALVLKDNPEILAYDTGWPGKLRELAARTDIPPIRYACEQYDDPTVARLYRMAAALVQPYRGEGFGLPVLEAMACGTPVIVTGGGSTDDFVDESVGFQLPAKRVSLGRALNEVALADEGWWLEADRDSLVAAYRRVYEHREEARAKGRAAAGRAHAGWTWADSARRLEACVDDLLARPARASGAYADPLDGYAFDFSSRHGEDGILDELFGRLRVVAPFFVELAAGTGEHGAAALLVRRCGWDGLMVEGDAAACDLLRERYRDAPGVCGATAFDPRVVPPTFDLLALGESDPSTWEALSDYRPRAVTATSSASGIAGLVRVAERLGYTLLAQTGRGCAAFLRDDLVPFAGFAPGQVRT